jgi:CheY-like chemotaxis protein
MKPDAGKKILIVDDTAFNIQIVAHILKSEGYQLAFAKDGKTAVDLAERIQFDLILLDLMMPDMDGYEVCRRIKKMENSNDIPIIFITGRVDPESIVQAFEAGGIDYIIKPFNHKELAARVKTHLDLIEKSRLLKKAYLNLEKKNEEITASIRYAKNIQNAILPNIDLIEQKFSDSFVYLNPRDIVSGDFYWFCEAGDKFYFAVIDCTGHGVPGAFMSMIANSLLNEIVFHKKVMIPSKILIQLHYELIKSLNQSGPEKKMQNDGMDITLAMIDFKWKEVFIASVGQWFYVVQDNQLKGFKGDKFFIGGKFLKNREPYFTDYKFSFDKELKIYMLSDGLTDQFGGETNEKFMNKRFETFILENHKLTMKQQKKQIELAYEKWEGKSRQIDDVIVVGIQLGL